MPKTSLDTCEKSPLVPPFFQGPTLSSNKKTKQKSLPLLYVACITAKQFKDLATAFKKKKNLCTSLAALSWTQKFIADFDDVRPHPRRESRGASQNRMQSGPTSTTTPRSHAFYLLAAFEWRLSNCKSSTQENNKLDSSTILWLQQVGRRERSMATTAQEVGLEAGQERSAWRNVNKRSGMAPPVTVGQW